jgi:hypothetical protein
LPLRNLGRAYADTGETSRGLELALRAESIGRAHLSLMARSLSEREALSYAAARPSGLDLALSLAMIGRLTPSSRGGVDAALRGGAGPLRTMRRRALS